MKLMVPPKWQVEPAELQFSLSRKSETFAAKFLLQVPSGVKPGSYSIDAAAIMGNQEFRSGYQTISYPENWTRNIYSQSPIQN